MISLIYCKNIDFDPTEIFFLNKGENLLEFVVNQGFDAADIKQSLLTQLFKISPSFFSKPKILENLPIDVALQLSFPKCHTQEHKLSSFSYGHRTRSLKLQNFTLGFHSFENHNYSNLEDMIEQKESKRGIVSILEIGIGQGRTLLELKNKFPKASLHGINKEENEFDFTGVKSLKETNHFFEINNNWNDEDFNRVNIKFTDLNSHYLKKYPAESMDVIFSYASIRYIKFKHLLIEEIWRTLKLGGTAIIDINLMFLNSTNNNDDLFHFFEEIPGLQYSRPNKVLMIEKVHQKPLRLNLVFDEESSVLHEWDPTISNKDSVGWNSVYKNIDV